MEKKVLYVGVSPKPYRGCCYWYVDESGQTMPKTYVWARMGRRNIEQIVFVDCVIFCNIDNAPYPYDSAKRILRQTTDEESKIANETWEIF